jgi:hypothetical protein
MRRRTRSRLAQASTEYMMVISVAVIGAVFAGYKFYEPIRSGFQAFGQKFEQFYAKPGGPQ